MRPLWIWIIFGFCLISIIIATVWVNDIVGTLENAQEEARKKAIIEENVRLALWRLDSYLAPIIAEENASPYFFYNSFYPLERAYTKMFDEIYAEELLVPSPLMTTPSENVLLHFQIDPNKQITSPQIPASNMQNRAKHNYTTDKNIDVSYNLLSLFRTKINTKTLENTLPKKVRKIKDPIVRKKKYKQQNSINSNSWQQKNESEFQIRKQYEQRSHNNARNRNPRSNVTEGVMKAKWQKELLLLARSVTIDDECYIQGCWLNWKKLRTKLLNNISDLLPNANLAPITNKQDKNRILAMLPVRLIPGTVNIENSEYLSPTKISLAVAWGCMFLAVIAITVLLFGVIAISERRASFVSSVTHELRTPITTFHMYAEMLHEGMVPPKKHKKYFNTMLTEAKRLTHLVENVLSYAKVERKRTQRDLKIVTIEELVSSMQNHLEQRTKQEKVTLTWNILNKKNTVFTDISIVEQIMFNLIDNACKYACNDNKKIDIEISSNYKQALLKVKDYGLGLKKKERKKLFRPFGKSAEEAANSKPGVGLGLALSYRLAKHIQAKLILKSSTNKGSEFVLNLPLKKKS